MGNSETKPIVNRDIKRSKFKSPRPLPPLPIEELPQAEDSDSDSPPSYPPPPPPKEDCELQHQEPLQNSFSTQDIIPPKDY